MRVEAVYALPERQCVLELELEADATLADALKRLQCHPDFARVEWTEVAVGIYGEVVAEPGRRLEPGDRIEIYRPLEVSPMEARRIRARSDNQ